MQIKEVAERSGFSPATLRYYEQIGLIPKAARTPAGYRTYGEATVERLAFIARAKQLGCSLDEIADLVVAWDGGRCGPVQDRLRSAVAGRIADAQRQIAELTALTADLERAAIALARHRPDGACDSDCGCISDPDAPGTTAVRLTAKPVSIEPPIACTLDREALPGRLDDWRALLAHATTRAAITNGIRVQLDSTVPPADVMRLVAAEQSCCQFLRFAITVDARGIGLEVTAPTDAQTIVAQLFGGNE